MSDDDIPFPPSADHGDQKQEPIEPDLVVHQPFIGKHFSNAVEGIKAASPGSLGGVAGSAYLAAWVNQMSDENTRLNMKIEQRDKEFKSELQRRDHEIKTEREEHHHTKSQLAVSNERIQSESRNRHLRNFGIAVGVGLMGVAANLATQPITPAFIISLSAGALLVLLCWFSHTGGGST